MSEDFHLILESLLNGNNRQVVGQILESYDNHYDFFHELSAYDGILPEVKSRLLGTLCTYMITVYCLPERKTGYFIASKWRPN